MSPGFRSARLRRDRNEKVVGFVDFDSEVDADRARQHLLGQVGLEIQFARSSTNRTKRGRHDDRDDRADSRHDARHEYGYSDMREVRQQYREPDPYRSLAPLPVPPMFPDMIRSIQLPADASSTIYVEGLPLDATEREISHIFRPHPGFCSLRIKQKESKRQEGHKFLLCFVEFETQLQAVVALQALQGYKMDKQDTKGLTLTFARTERHRRFGGDRDRHDDRD
eukprot:CAMPEP_0114558796 /NCGR_PEP_ID=MMETSP0114-20121206/10577_1 /TAXON_ID=31324 /ORGANISM="Goniomonas sp, Strain m" /LENGTH=223 /DNA_ID=CAMNT_0001744219 /DNA_START=38 /DNA_END=709 /DNA_ORIENTATION=-